MNCDFVQSLNRHFRLAFVAAILVLGGGTAEAAYTILVAGNNVTFTGDAAGDTLILSNSGGNLAHNLPDAGYASPTDLDVGAGVVTRAVGSLTSLLVLAGDGTDTVNASALTGLTITITINGGPGNDTLTGSPTNDILIVGTGVDDLTGNNGDDVFDLSGANATVSPGGGFDTIRYTAGAGGETVVLSATATERLEVFGGAGVDNFTVSGGAQQFFVTGGGNNDTIDGSGITNAAASVTLNGGPGNDTITGGAAGDMIVGGGGADTMTGNAGDDIFDLSGGTASVSPGNGFDIIRYTVANPAGETVNIGATATERVEIFGGPGPDNLTVTGGAPEYFIDAAGGNDLVNASSTTNGSASITLIGGPGDDGLTGSIGNDLIIGGPNNDTMGGGPGSDTYRFGDGGNDVVNDSSGNDTFDFSLAPSGVTFTMGATGIQALPGGQVDLFSGFIENYIGSAQGDSFSFTFAAAGPALSLDGGGGSDSATFNGSGNADNIGVAAAAVTFGALTINHSNLETLTLRPAGNNDTVNVNVSGATALTALTVNTEGMGADILNVQGTVPALTTALTSNAGGAYTATLGSGGNMQNILGAVNIGNPTGTVALTYDNSNDPTGRVVTMTATAVTGLAPGAITFANLSSLTVNTGAGADSINVNGVIANITTTVDGGNQNDTFNFPATSVGASSTLNLNGGGNDDTFNASFAGTGTQTLNGGAGLNTAALNATAAADNVTVASTQVTLMGASPLNFTQVQTLTVNTLAGNDLVTVNAAGGSSVTNATVNTGANGDTVNVLALTAGFATTINTGADGPDEVNIGFTPPGFGTGSLNLIGAAISVNDSNGGATLNIDDTNDATADTITLTSSQLNGASTFPIDFTGVGFLNIREGSAGNTVNITSTAANMTSTFNTGSGNDTIRIGAAGSLDNLAGSISVDAGGGATDLVRFDDVGDATGNAYTLTTGSLLRAGIPPITYSNTESVIVDGGGGANLFNLQASVAATPVTLNGGGGIDTFQLAAGDLSVLAGAVTVNGNGGADTATLADNTPVTGATYTVTATTVARAGFGGLTYGTLETLVLNSQAGNDTVNIQGTAAGTLFTVNGGNGDELFNVGTGNLNALPGAVLLNGDAGAADVVVVNDTALAAGANYAVTAAGVTRAGFGGVTFGTVEGLTVNTQSGNDSIDVLATAAATPVSINSGAGTDTFNISTGILSSVAGVLSIDGGAASDTATFNDNTPAGGATYVVTTTTLNRSGAALITYAGMEGLTLNTQAGNDIINMQNTFAAAPWTVNGGNGDDAITLAAGDLAVLAGAITVNGGGGTDTVTLNDGTPATGAAYTVTATTLTRAAFGGLTYGTLEALVLNAQAGNDTVAVQGTAAGTALTLNGGAGDDAFSVGSGSLDALPGAVTVNGDGGTDAVTVDDTAQSAGAAFTITDTTVGRGGFGGVTFGTSESLTVNTQSGNDTIAVQSIGAATPLALNAGSGDDVINLGNANSVDALNGALTVAGGAHTSGDRLNLNDQANAADTTYDVGSTNVTRGSKVFNYSAIETVAVNAGSGNDLVNAALSATTAFILDGGASGAVGDMLDFDEQGLTVTLTGALPPGAGTFSAAGLLSLSFANFENGNRAGAPVVQSVSFTPANPRPREPVTFTVLASDPESNPLSITFNYGDGTTDTLGVHTYDVVGAYLVTVTVSDGSQPATVKQLTVLVAGEFGDSDGDGYSDAIEDVGGTNPNDINDTPIDDKMIDKYEPLTIKKIRAKLAFFSPNSDSIQFMGSLVVPQERLDFDAKRFIVDCGGVIRIFDITGRKAVDGKAVLIVKRPKPNMIVFFAKLGSGNYKSALANSANLTDGTARNAPRQIPVSAIFSTTNFRTLHPVKYSTRLGRLGLAR